MAQSHRVLLGRVQGDSGDSLTFRPMTANLHDWVPVGTAGLFVGEGNPQNSPTRPGLTDQKWRFICSANADGEMTMTAMTIATHPNRTRMFQKTRKAGDTWDYRWVEFANEYNLKIAGRNTRLVNADRWDDAVPVGPWRFGQDEGRGYRVSHHGLIHRRSGSAHKVEQIEHLRELLQPGRLTTEGRRLDNGPHQQSLSTYMRIEFKDRRGVQRMRRWRYAAFINSPGTPRYRYSFNVQPYWNAPQLTNSEVIRITAILDFRAVTNTSALWGTWSGRSTTPVEPEQAIGFVGSHSWGGINHWLRINYVWPHDVTQAERRTPAGKVVKVDFEYIPYQMLVLATMQFFTRQPPGEGPPPLPNT